MSSYEGLCPDCQQVECDEACMKATSDVKLLPLPEDLRYRCGCYGYTGQAEHDATVANYARACIEANRNARADEALTEARQIIDEFLQCARIGRPPGKLLAQASDWLGQTPGSES